MTVNVGFFACGSAMMVPGAAPGSVRRRTSLRLRWRRWLWAMCANSQVLFTKSLLHIFPIQHREAPNAEGNAEQAARTDAGNGGDDAGGIGQLVVLQILHVQRAVEDK